MRCFGPRGAFRGRNSPEPSRRPRRQVLNTCPVEPSHASNLPHYNQHLHGHTYMALHSIRDSMDSSYTQHTSRICKTLSVLRSNRRLDFAAPQPEAKALACQNAASTALRIVVLNPCLRHVLPPASALWTFCSRLAISCCYTGFSDAGLEA